MNKPYFVGLAGGSASGKTFFLKQLLASFPESEVTLISQDNYYRDKSQQKVDEKGWINFDHPNAVDLDSLDRDLSLLSEGKSITLKEYAFHNPKAPPKTVHYKPSTIILVEGLFVFYHETINRRFDLKIFVDADEHIKLSRRIKRDFEERGYDLEEVLYRYEAHVIPMYKKFVLPYKEQCDLILPNNFHMQRAIQVVVNHFRAVIAERSNG